MIKSIKRFWKILLVVLILAVVFITLSIRHSILQGSSPWFGRGENLPPLRYSVLVGPVDMDNGIPGVIEIGMTRSTLLKKLWQPILEGMSSKEASKKGFIDPEDVSADFFDGIFAWVQYGDKDRVISIDFDLTGFSKKFKGKQNILLTVNGKNHLLNEDLTRKQVIKMLSSDPKPPRLQFIDKDIIIKNSGLVLGFNGKDHLYHVSIIDYRF